MSLIVKGLAAPFDTPALISGPQPFVEVLRRGCFRDSLKARPTVPLLAQHDRQRFPLGVATLLEETAEGLVAEFRVTEGAPLAREAWAHIRSGALPGLSIGFRPLESVWTLATTPDERDVVERIRVNLVEVSAVPVPAYPTALVTAAVDDQLATPHLDDALAWLDALKAA